MIRKNLKRTPTRLEKAGIPFPCLFDMPYQKIRDQETLEVVLVLLDSKVSSVAVAK
jgi:hypothetical protein